MIYELRLMQVRPRGAPEFEKLLEQALPARRQSARLIGCWHTEVGPLNQVVELWAFAGRGEYDAAARTEAWPPAGGDLVLGRRVELLHSAPFNRPLQNNMVLLPAAFSPLQ